MVPITGCTARAAPKAPELSDVIWSLIQALKPISFPMEPKKLMIASAATTANAIPISAESLPLFINSVVPKIMVKIPQRIYPTDTRVFLLPFLSETHPKRNVETVVAAADIASIHEMIVGSLAILAYTKVLNH